MRLGSNRACPRLRPRLLLGELHYPVSPASFTSGSDDEQETSELNDDEADKQLEADEDAVQITLAYFST